MSQFSAITCRPITLEHQSVYIIRGGYSCTLENGKRELEIFHRFQWRNRIVLATSHCKKCSSATFHSFIFMPTFPLRRLRRQHNSPRRTRNISLSTAISEFCRLHTETGPSQFGYVHAPLVLGRPLGRFLEDVALASRTCLANLSWSILDTWPNRRSWISRFGEVFRHSELYEFHTLRTLSHSMNSSKKSRLHRLHLG